MYPPPSVVIVPLPCLLYNEYTAYFYVNLAFSHKIVYNDFKEGDAQWTG